MEEPDIECPFVTRRSICRTPPPGQHRSDGGEAGAAKPSASGTSSGGKTAGKRPLTSPETIAAQRSKVAAAERRKPSIRQTAGSAPPVAGLLLSTPSAAGADTSLETSQPPQLPLAQQQQPRSGATELEVNLETATKLELLERTRRNMALIMGMITGPGSKLNKGDTATISALGQEIVAIVGAMDVRVAEAELNASRAELRCEELRTALAKAAAGAAASGSGVGAACSSAPTPTTGPLTYANTLRLNQKNRGTPAQPVQQHHIASGPVLVFYPTEEAAPELKTAEDNKRVLKKAVRPKDLNVQVERVRVRERLYIGWDVVTPGDYIDVTFCQKCHQYGPQWEL